MGASTCLQRLELNGGVLPMPIFIRFRVNPSSDPVRIGQMEANGSITCSSNIRSLKMLMVCHVIIAISTSCKVDARKHTAIIHVQWYVEYKYMLTTSVTLRLLMDQQSQIRRAAQQTLYNQVLQITAFIITTVLPTFIQLIRTHFVKQPYHTSILTGQGWVNELLPLLMFGFASESEKK